MLNSLARGLALTRKELGPDITVLRLSILLCAHANEGVSQRELLAHLDQVSVTALSRNLADLSALSARKTPGLDLIELRSDPMNLRIKRVHLTDRGRKFVTRLVKTMAMPPRRTS